MAAQSKENSAKQHTLQKQTSKLENDVVQAHSYWKKQWAELNKRLHKCETNRVDDLYVKQVTIATLNAENQTIRNICETAVQEAIQKQIAPHALAIKEDFASQAEEHTKELKEYMEKAAQVYQDELTQYGMKQQTALQQLVQSWQQQQKGAQHTSTPIQTPEARQVPEIVDIHTTASQMGMSRKSVDPPDEAPTQQQRQRARSTLDVRVQDDSRVAQRHCPPQDDDTIDTLRQNRWSTVEAPRDRVYDAMEQKDYAIRTPPMRQHDRGEGPGNQRAQQNTDGCSGLPRYNPYRRPVERQDLPRHPAQYHRETRQTQVIGQNLQDTFDRELEQAFNKDQDYLMGLDGIEDLTLCDLENIGFVEPRKAYRAFHLEHQTLMANWHMTTSRGKIVGPNQKQLLQDINIFNPLASTRQADVIDFVAQFHDLMDSYNIVVMPFSMIEVKFGVVGLCLPGVGEMKYDRMGQALSKILYGHLIPHNIDRCGKLDQLLLNAKNKIPPNGYEMLHILLVQYVDPFKPHMVDIKWPTFSSCKNIYDYAGQFSVTMQLYEKKGERIEPRKAAIKFLEAVKKEGGVTYNAAALLLKTAILERPPTADLPARFTIGNMATFIADSNANTSDEDEDSPQKSSTRIFKNQVPPRSIMHGPDHHQWIQEPAKTSIPTTVEQSSHTAPTQRASVSTLTSELNRYMQGYTPHRHRINQTYRTKKEKDSRPTPEPHLYLNNPRRRRAYDPYTKCHACGRTGHTVVQCDTLAMAILIRKYMQESGNATAMQQASDNWFKRNEEALICPNSEAASTAKPLQVLHTYMDRYLKDLDELDDQIDWEFFRDEDSGSQEGQE